MASLTGKSIASTYPLLLKIQSADDNNTTGIDGTLRFAEDGDGTASALKISTAGIQSTGTLTINGTSTLTGDVTLGAGLTVGTNIAFATTATAFTGANRIVFKAGSSQDLNLRLEASNAEQNTDNWQVQIADGDAFRIQSKASGSYVNKLSLDSNGDTVIAGNLDVVGNVNIQGGDITTDAGDIAIKSNGNLTFLLDDNNDETSQSFGFYNDTTEIANLDESGNLQIDGSLTVGGNVIKASDGGSTITMDTSDNVTIAGSLAIQGSILTMAGGGVMSPAATAHNVAGAGVVISAGDTTAGTTNNIAGGELTLEGGRGKGSGAGGNIVFKVANAGSSGSSLNSLATALTIDDSTAATFNSTVTCTSLVATGIASPTTDDITMYANKSFFVILDNDDNVDEAGHNSTFTVKDHDSTSLLNVDESGNITITGTTQLNDALTVGVDDTGYDVKFFGATSGSFMLWDESDDALELTDSTPIKIGDGGDMQIYHNGSNSFITNSTGIMNLATENSGIAVSIGHTTSETTINDNLNITGALVATRDSATLLTTNGTIPITGTCAQITSTGAASGIRFAGGGTAGQILFVNNTGANPITFHNTEATALVRGIHADHDTMEANFMGMFVSDGTYWNLIAGGVDSQPDVGLTAS